MTNVAASSRLAIPIKFNRYPNAYTKAPAEQAETDWAGLCQRLERLTKTTAKRGADKRTLPAWTAADMAEAYNNDENTRALTALPIDVDTAPDALLEVLEASCLNLFAYASPSDPNPDGTRRLRIVAELSRPIAPAEVEHARLALAEHLGIGPGQGVESAKAVSQVMFAGRLHGTPPRDTWRFEGEALDVDDLMSTKLEQDWRTQPKSGAPSPRAHRGEPVDHTPIGELRERDEPVLAALLELHTAPGEDTDRRMRLRATGAYLALRMRSEKAIAAIVSRIPTKRGPARAVAEALGGARDELRGVPNVVCWDRLHALNPGAADRLDRACDDHFDRWCRARREGKAKAANTNAGPGGGEFAPPTNAAEPVFAMTRGSGSPSYFIRDTRSDGTYVECGNHAVHAVLRETGSNMLIETKDGKRRISVQALADEYGHTIGGVEWDYGRSGAIVFDREKNVMLCGVTCPKIEPQHDPGVADWLRALSGSDQRLAALHEWIASTRQDQIHRLATALLIVGPHGVGKSVFAVMVARLWGAVVPVDLAHVVKQFNASMTACPIVADDECKTLARKIITTEEFRNVITNRARQYEPKNKEMRTLHGAQRFVLSANDVGAFTFANSVGAGAVDAIAERLFQIVVSKDDAPNVRARLDAIRGADGEIDFARTSGHLEWVRQNTALPDASVRFLGSDPDKDAARVAVVASTVEANEGLFSVVRRVLEGHGTQWDSSLFGRDGALWVRATELTRELAQAAPEERWDSSKVRRALGSFRGPRRAVRRGESTVTAWELDPVRLAQALGVEVERARAVCASPTEAKSRLPAKNKFADRA